MEDIRCIRLAMVSKQVALSRLAVVVKRPGRRIFRVNFGPTKVSFPPEARHVSKGGTSPSRQTFLVVALHISPLRAWITLLAPSGSIVHRAHGPHSLRGFERLHAILISRSLVLQRHDDSHRVLTRRILTRLGMPPKKKKGGVWGNDDLQKEVNPQTCAWSTDVQRLRWNELNSLQRFEARRA
jgi:hypothetical protein